MFILVSIALMGYLKTDVTAQQESSSFMLNNLQNNEFKLYTFNGVDVSNEYNDEFMDLFATNDDDRIKDFIAENKLLIITNNNDNEEFEANAKKITQEIDYDQLLSLTPVTVKMYFPGDVSACLYPVDGPIHTKICITVKFYTYRMCCKTPCFSYGDIKHP